MGPGFVGSGENERLSVRAAYDRRHDVLLNGVLRGEPSRIRTGDPQLKRLVLYLTELTAHTLHSPGRAELSDLHFRPRLADIAS